MYDALRAQVQPKCTVSQTNELSWLQKMESRNPPNHSFPRWRPLCQACNQMPNDDITNFTARVLNPRVPHVAPSRADYQHILQLISKGPSFVLSLSHWEAISFTPSYQPSWLVHHRSFHPPATAPHASCTYMWQTTLRLIQIS
jgi:hypothetical protein